MFFRSRELHFVRMDVDVFRLQHIRTYVAPFPVCAMAMARKPLPFRRDEVYAGNEKFLERKSNCG